LIVYLNNIIKNPNEEKFKKLNLLGKAFSDRVSSCYGGLGSLEAIGFETTQDNFIVLNKLNMQLLQQCAQHLEKIKSNLK